MSLSKEFFDFLDQIDLSGEDKEVIEYQSRKLIILIIGYLIKENNITREELEKVLTGQD